MYEFWANYEENESRKSTITNYVFTSSRLFLILHGYLKFALGDVEIGYRNL